MTDRSASGGGPDIGGTEDRQGAAIRRGDVFALVAVVTVTVAVQAALWRRFDRPLWYDELWRPHFVAEPLTSFWSELAAANTPSALGSVALLRAAGEVFGWHAWSLRLPSAASLTALAVLTYLLARRFTAVTAATAAAVTACLAGTVVDLATQVKPYTLEAACAVAVVMLWTGPARPSATEATGGDGATGGGARPVLRRTAAGILSLFCLPAIFLIIPLAVADVLRALGDATGSRAGHARSEAAGRVMGPVAGRTVGAAGPAAGPAAGRAVLGAAPAVVIAGIHAVLFVLHQSSQRASTFWDDHFLAGRGPGEAAWFVVDQLAATAAGAPPGVDRYDPNLVHPLSDPSRTLVIMLGCAVAITFLAGARVLGRRRDGRTLLVAVGGCEVLMLAASAGRYWPFGAVRTNLFAVPLLTAVVAVGAAALATRAGRLVGRPHASGSPPARVMIAVLAAVPVLGTAAVPVAGASALHPLWEARAAQRPIDLMVDVTIAARRLYQPGDLVLVGGRLARAGWLYGMEVSEDRAFEDLDATGGGIDGGIDSGGSPAQPRLGPVGPRVPRSSTVFLTAIGDGGVGRALALNEPGAGGRVILFVLAYDRRGTDRALGEARAAGWCPSWQHAFALTGTLHVLAACAR